MATLFVLYLFVVGRCLWIAVHARDTHARLLAGSLGLAFFVYVLVNGGMISGLLPVVGIPMPLIDQGFLLGRAAFALEEATRDAATGVELLLIVAGQREEVLALTRALGGNGGDQQHGVVELDDDGATGLAGDFASLKRDGVLAVLEGFGDFCHGWMSLGMLSANWTVGDPCRQRVTGSIVQR